MAGEGKDLVLFLERDALFLSEGDKVFRLDFPLEVVRDLDVVNKEGLLNLVEAFIINSRVSPANVLLVISESVCFSQDLIGGDEAESRIETQNFINTVPFNQVLSKKYQTTQGVRIMATNQELVEGVFAAFERKGFKLEAVVPASIFGAIGLKKLLDTAMVKYFLENKEKLIGQSLLKNKEIPSNQGIILAKPKSKSKTLPYLIGIFLLSLVILVWLLTK